MIPAQLQTQACILRNTTAAVFVTSVLTYISSTYDHFKAPSEPEWTVFALVCLFIYFLSSLSLYFLSSARAPMRAANRVSVGFLFIGVNMLMMTMGKQYATVIPYALCISVGILMSMSVLAHVAPESLLRAMYSWFFGIFVCAIVSLIVSILAYFVLNIASPVLLPEGYVTVPLSIVSAFFSFMIAADIHHYVKDCTGADCCERGTVAIWLDFVNVLQRVIIALNELNE